MFRNSFERILTIWLVILFVRPVFAQPVTGQITGLVLSQKGTPVAGAQVSPQFLGVTVMRSLVVTVETDASGRFKIERLQWGPYAVYAAKEADGYPNTRFTVYRTRPAPRVTLSPAKPTAHVVVTIGPRGGVLVGSVRDANTNAPLATQFVLQRKKGGDTLMLSEPPDFKVLLPADIDVAIKVREAGYKPWEYRTASGRWFRLKSGQQMRLEIRLIASEKNRR